MENKNKAFLTSAIINVALFIIVFTLFNHNLIENSTKNMIITAVFIVIFEIIKIKIIEKYYNL